MKPLLGLLLVLLGALFQDDRASALRELAELSRLDLSQTIVERFAARVAPGAELASDGEALALVARARFDVGDEEGALALLRDARPQSGAPRVAIEEARLLIELDRLDEALERLTLREGEALRPRFPDEPHAWLHLARLQVRRGRDEGVEAACRRFLELSPLDPEAPRAWHILGTLASRARDVDRARACFERAAQLTRWHDVYRARLVQLRRDPGDPLPRLGLALLWLEADDPGRARDLLARLVADHPDFCRGWRHLGEARAALAEDARALEAFDRALACDGTDAHALHRRALLRLKLADTTGAREDLEHLLAGPSADEPDFLEAHLVLARLFDRAGDDAAAAERYATYRSLGGEEPLQE